MGASGPVGRGIESKRFQGTLRRTALLDLHDAPDGVQTLAQEELRLWCPEMAGGAL